MKKKLRSVLAKKCKDFGLTEKALDELSEIGSKDLTDESTDEDIAAAADLLVPFAKAMQGEITRKTQKPKPSAKQSTEEDEEDDNSGEGKGEGEKKPSWYKKVMDRLETLEQENKTLKEKEAATERAKTIADKAKKLGIPEFLLEGRTFDPEADIDKALADFKQNLVNHNLMSKGQGHVTATAKEQMTAEEDAWAKGLPDKN